ncbi:MFS transporter [Candidatus Bipolaricaulota bacterium]|nr:MFS transporter [Candidatus Bipolaricaulota bacterium]
MTDRLQSKETGAALKRKAFAFIVLFGLVSLLADMTYEGARSLVGQFMEVLGASATAVGFAVGAGEFLGYAIRFFSGKLADRTRRYWAIVIAGYAIQLGAIPLLALVGRWELAVLLVFAERLGKGLRNPSRDALLSYAASRTGRGLGFGLHEAMDQIGAFLGPAFLSLLLLAGTGGADSAATYRLGFALLGIPAALAVLAVLAARFLFPRPSDLEASSHAPRLGRTGFSSAYRWYLASAALLAAGVADFPLVAFHLGRTGGLPETFIPMLYAGAMAVDAGAALLVGLLYDRIGFAVLPVMWTLEVFTAPLLFLGGPASVVAGMALWGISMGTQESVMRAVIADLVPHDRRATAYGLFHIVFGGAWFAGSALMGLLYDRAPVYLVSFSVAMQVLSVAVLLFAWRVQMGERTP